MNNFKFNKDLLFLPFDLYGRYRIIAELIQTIRTKDKIRILDVGGNIEAIRYGVLKKFLPSDHIIVVDKTENNYKDYIQANALNLPFGQGEFDLVVSADVLEHIPGDKREKFLEEQLRVCKEGVILASPFFSKETVKAERIAGAFYKSLSNKDHRWLSEHKKFTLPYISWFESFIKKHKLHFEKVAHNNIFYWTLMTFLHFYVEHVPKQNEKLLEVDQFYNSYVFPCDVKKPAYRYIYLITKRKFTKKYQKYDLNSREDFLPTLQQMILELIGSSTQDLLHDSAELTRIVNLRRWRFASSVHNVKKQMPILKNI